MNGFMGTYSAFNRLYSSNALKVILLIRLAALGRLSNRRLWDELSSVSCMDVLNMLSREDRAFKKVTQLSWIWIHQGIAQKI